MRNIRVFILLVSLFVGCISCNSEDGGGKASTPSFSLSSTRLSANGLDGTISSLMFNSNNDLFVGLSDINNTGANDGLYKSSDGGATFSKYDVSDGLLFDSICHISEGPGEIIYATHYYINNGGATLGYSKSTDSSGTEYNTVIAPLDNPDERYIHINSLGHIFTVGNSTIERSTDGGVSFTNLGVGGLDARLWIGKTTGNIYFKTSALSALQISTDNGNTFTTRGTDVGLASTSITDVEEDSAGNIYVTSDDNMGAGHPGGLVVSVDGGATFIQRLLPLNRTRRRRTFKISINSSNLLCVTHSEGFSCSKDSGYTWYTYDQGLQAYNIAISHNDIIAFHTLSSGTVKYSNGILPNGMGTSFVDGVIPAEVKLSNLPVGTYTRSSSKVYTYAESGANKSMFVFVADDADVTLSNSEVLDGDTLNSTINTYASFEKMADGSVDWVDGTQIIGDIALGNVFSGSVTIASPGAVNQSVANIATAEAAAKDPASFVEYRWLSDSVLRRTIFLHTRVDTLFTDWYIYEDYNYSP